MSHQNSSRCYFCLTTETSSQDIPFYNKFYICPDCVPRVMTLDSVNLNNIFEQSTNPAVFKKQMAEAYKEHQMSPQEKEIQKKKKEKERSVMILKGLKERLQDQVMEQDHIISEVVPKVLIHNLSTEKTKPLSFFFAGPTGVGKTELSEQLSKNLNIDFLKFDMSEYKHSHNISRLIGSPPSYVGYGKPVALEKINGKKAVILFDEIEKAHPDVFDTFLQLLDKGTITTGAGKELNLKETIVIFTSNLGADAVKNKSKVMGLIGSNEPSEQIYKEAVMSHFRPEMVNRMDSILFFNSLSEKGLKTILDKFSDMLNNRLLKGHGVTFEMGDKLISKVLKEGFNPTMGARPLLRTLEKLVMEPIAQKILLEDKEDCAMFINLVNDKVEVVSIINRPNSSRKQESVFEMIQNVKEREH